MDAQKLDEYENKWLERLERYEKKHEEFEAEQKKKLGKFYISPEERKAWRKANAGKTAEDFMKELQEESYKNQPTQKEQEGVFEKMMKKPKATS